MNWLDPNDYSPGLLGVRTAPHFPTLQYWATRLQPLIDPDPTLVARARGQRARDLRAKHPESRSDPQAASRKDDFRG